MNPTTPESGSEGYGAPSLAFRAAMSLKWILDQYYRSLKFLLGLLMGLMILPVSLQIASRYSDFVPFFVWTEEVARFCFVWIIMIGSMIAVRDDAHFDVDLFAAPQTDRQRGLAKLVVHVLMLLLAAVFAWYGFEFARFGAIQTSEMWGINMLSIYISFPLAGVTWSVFLLEKMIADIKLVLRKAAETEAIPASEMESQ